MKKHPNAPKADNNRLTIVPPESPSYEDILLLNPKKEPLTPAVLRTFEGFHDFSEEEAQNICVTSLSFAQILLETIARKGTITIDNQHVVCLSDQNETPVIEINTGNSKPYKHKAA